MSERTLNAFLLQYLDDQATGQRRPLGDYQARFPGHDDLIAEQYARYESEGGETGNDSPFSVLDHIGPYRLVSELGRGGQGVVYLAEDDRLHRKVALKVLTGLGSLAPDRVARFLREAEVASRLDHPGIATVYEIGTHGGTPYIAMRYVEGTTLAGQIGEAKKAGGMAGTAGGLTTITERVARALHAAHEAGVIHRDVKPGNILIPPSGEPVIVDFGLAHDADGSLETITRTGDFFGTPAYMSPEQITTQRIAPDRRTDVWSLGATLYESLTLKRPFEAPTREHLYREILSREPDDIRRLNPAVSEDLAAIVETALQKEVDRRYQTAAAMADDLAAFADGRPVAARRVGPLGNLARWSRREPAKAALLLLLLIALPTIAVLLASHFANRERVESARLAKLGEDKDEMLSRGFYAYGDNDPAQAIACFETALSMEGGSPEAVLGIALASLRLARPQPALETLDVHRDLVAGLRATIKLRVLAHRRLGNESEAISLERQAPAGSTPIDFYIEGEELSDQGRAGKDGAWTAAVESFRQAIFRSTKPRALYFEGLARAAQRAGDKVAAREVAPALMAHWPHSARCAFLAGTALSIVSAEAGIADLQEAIKINPEFAEAHSNLAHALARKGLFDDAIASFREAIRIRPDSPEAIHGLAYSLQKKGSLDDAIAAYRRAISLKPDDAELFYNLGNALREKGLLEDGVAAYRDAVRIKPDYPEANCNLGKTLVMTGQLSAGLEAVRRGHELGSRKAGWSFPSARWVAEIEALVSDEQRMLAVASGTESADGPADVLHLADLASLTRRWDLAAKWYEGALDSDPSLTRAPDQWGLKAAQAAVQAASGAGSESRSPSQIDAPRLRKRARAWLEGELGHYRDALENDAAEVERRRKGLAGWSSDPLLAPVRDPVQIATLPPDEARAWASFWASVKQAADSRKAPESR